MDCVALTFSVVTHSTISLCLLPFLLDTIAYEMCIKQAVTLVSPCVLGM